MSIPAPSDCVIAHAELRHRAREACDRRAEPRTPLRQRGAALVIGLIMIALLSLLGLTALSASLLEERMAFNARDRIRAFQAAEAALRFCESSIRPSTVFNNSNGFYKPAAGGVPRWESVDWESNADVMCYPTDHDCVSDTETADIPRLSRQPACIVEQLAAEINASPGAAESRRGGLPVETERVYRHYRITARGWGLSKHTEVMLQSHARLETE